AVRGIAAAVRAGSGHPDRSHVLDRHADRVGNAVAHEVRLLRAGPAGHEAVLDLDGRAGRTHGGVRLERPLVFGLDDARGVLEGVVHVAVLLVHRALAHGRVAHVTVDPGLA